MRLGEINNDLSLLLYMMNVFFYQMMVFVLGDKKMGIHFYNLKVRVAESWSLSSYSFLIKLNLFSLLKLSQQNLVGRYKLTKTKVVEIFEFGKNN